MDADTLYVDIISSVFNKEIQSVFDLTRHECHVYKKLYKGKYLLCNDVVAKHSGLESAEEISNYSDQDLWPQALAQIYSNDQKVVESGVILGIPETEVLFKNGQLLDVYSFKRPFYANGKAVGIEGVSYIMKKSCGKDLECRSRFLLIPVGQQECLLEILNGASLREVAHKFDISLKSAAKLFRRGLDNLGCPNRDTLIERIGRFKLELALQCKMAK